MSMLFFSSFTIFECSETLIIVRRILDNTIYSTTGDSCCTLLWHESICRAFLIGLPPRSPFCLPAHSCVVLFENLAKSNLITSFNSNQYVCVYSPVFITIICSTLNVTLFRHIYKRWYCVRLFYFWGGSRWSFATAVWLLLIRTLFLENSFYVSLINHYFSSSTVTPLNFRCYLQVFPAKEPDSTSLPLLCSCLSGFGFYI